MHKIAPSRILVCLCLLSPLNYRWTLRFIFLRCMIVLSLDSDWSTGENFYYSWHHFGEDKIWKSRFAIPTFLKISSQLFEFYFQQAYVDVCNISNSEIYVQIFFSFQPWIECKLNSNLSVVIKPRGFHDFLWN